MVHERIIELLALPALMHTGIHEAQILCQMREMGEGMELSRLHAAIADLERAGVVTRIDDMVWLGDSDTGRMHEAYRMSTMLLLAGSRAARTMAWIPWVRFVGVCNSVAFTAADKKSDIDFFIVARAGRLWTVRLLSALTLAIRGMLRWHGVYAGKVCLSFLVDEQSFEVDMIKKKPEDPYFDAWLVSLIPLIDDGWYDQECARMGVSGSGASGVFLHPRGHSMGWVKRTAERYISSAIAERLEHLFYTFQVVRISHHRHSRVHTGGTDVIVAPGVIKFHEQDRRTYFAQKKRECVAHSLHLWYLYRDSSNSRTGKDAS